MKKYVSLMCFFIFQSLFCMEEGIFADLTPDSDAACVAALPELSLELYPDEPEKKKPSGSAFPLLNMINEKSQVYQSRQRAVEKLVACKPDGILKFLYYRHTICSGMSPEYLSELSVRSVYCSPAYCKRHHCYKKDCLRLYGWQAYLLMPKVMPTHDEAPVDWEVGGLSATDVGIQNAVNRQAGIQILAKSTPGGSKNVVRNLGNRSLGNPLQ